jgi:CheY-like chemotaxis protein/PAS domain-containing protein
MVLGSALARSRGGAILFAALVLVALGGLAVRSSTGSAAALVVATSTGVLGVLGLCLWVAARQGTTREHDIAARELQTLRTAAELAGIGEWRWDLRTQRITYGRGCAKMLGYADGEIHSTLSAWGKLAHPDDLPRMRAAVDDLVEGRIAEYEQRVRLRAKDGSWRTIVDRGRIVARDRNGRPTLAIGVHVDAGASIAATERVQHPLANTCVVVDDDEDVRTVVAAAARRAGLQVVTFADAQSAWRAIDDGGAPLAIVTDFDMPGMSGMQLAERVRAAGMQCPVLLVSGGLPAELQLGDAVTGVLAKPFTLAEIAARLCDLIGPSRSM